MISGELRESWADDFGRNETLLGLGPDDVDQIFPRPGATSPQGYAAPHAPPSARRASRPPSPSEVRVFGRPQAPRQPPHSIPRPAAAAALAPPQPPGSALRTPIPAPPRRAPSAPPPSRPNHALPTPLPLAVPVTGALLSAETTAPGVPSALAAHHENEAMNTELLLLSNQVKRSQRAYLVWGGLALLSLGMLLIAFLAVSLG